jgi:hypothetical protein
VPEGFDVDVMPEIRHLADRIESLELIVQRHQQQIDLQVSVINELRKEITVLQGKIYSRR